MRHAAMCYGEPSDRQFFATSKAEFVSHANSLLFPLTWGESPIWISLEPNSAVSVPISSKKSTAKQRTPDCR
ncbi:hypothetical protein FF011L_47180 [Roseimaritima multifibrata]|uniref:Uncharacterized protein n=1 Tax=Roseimaritima multifibrata TaxID=1930274 RepID=A0A517MMB4_9BACT|nr:hypothetical protein FF011L_47180 [Roseimaritima multifibrata]